MITVSQACIDGGAVMAYFDRPDVKTAWHVSQDLQWSICNNNRSFAYSRTEQDERVDVRCPPHVRNYEVR